MNSLINKRKFVIHEHHAERAKLHYDIRLEKDGVLKSWACRKIPELISGESKKILLNQTPDHDYDEWIKFKGPIESGYGKGMVYIWDQGSFYEIKWDEHIIIDFKAKKIKGIYVIIPYPNEEGKFLMFKKKV